MKTSILIFLFLPLAFCSQQKISDLVNQSDPQVLSAEVSFECEEFPESIGHCELIVVRHEDKRIERQINEVLLNLKVDSGKYSLKNHLIEKENHLIELCEDDEIHGTCYNKYIESSFNQNDLLSLKLKQECFLSTFYSVECYNFSLKSGEKLDLDDTFIKKDKLLEKCDSALSRAIETSFKEMKDDDFAPDQHFVLEDLKREFELEDLCNFSFAEENGVMGISFHIDYKIPLLIEYGIVDFDIFFEPEEIDVFLSQSFKSLLKNS